MQILVKCGQDDVSRGIWWTIRCQAELPSELDNLNPEPTISSQYCVSHLGSLTKLQTVACLQGDILCLESIPFCGVLPWTRIRIPRKWPHLTSPARWQGTTASLLVSWRALGQLPCARPLQENYAEDPPATTVWVGPPEVDPVDLLSFPGAPTLPPPTRFKQHLVPSNQAALKSGPQDFVERKDRPIFLLPG